MDVSPVSTGTVQLNQTTPLSYPTESTFDSGESVRLEAVPAPGYQFDSWDGDLSDTTNPISISMTCNNRVIAKFSQIITSDVGSNTSRPNWWLVGGITAILLILLTTWLALRARTSR